MLAEIFTSNTRAEVMRILFDGNQEEHYLREIEKLSSIKINSVQKEIKHLSSLDLIKRRKSGNRIYYRANVEHPLYADLVSIVEKTVGITYLLKERLNNSQINCAFIFGSMVKGNEQARSDIDLMVIGSIRMRALTTLLSGLQQKIGREINPHIYSKKEFLKRISAGDHFVVSVLKSEIKELIGNIDEYR